MSGVSGIAKIPELRKRILFSLGVLAVYRLGVHVPTPGVDSAALQQFLKNLPVFGWFNIFSGGALERFSIFALGVMPYISSSIIMQLLTVSWDKLQQLQKEGEQGRKKITQYTRYLTVAISLIQGWGMATMLQNASAGNIVGSPGLTFQIMTAITLCTGTMFLMWLGEQISERGIGNGTSIIIFGGIASGIPSAVMNTYSLFQTGELPFWKLASVVLIIGGIFFSIIFMERATRRVQIQYAKRIVGRKVYGGQNTHLPLKINISGVIPPIFASSILMFPATLANFIPVLNKWGIHNWFQYGGVIYNIFFVGFIVFFCYFYTSIVFKTDDVADNLKKNGGFIPGVRPGPETRDYLNSLIERLTLGGAVYISVICVLPTLLIESVGAPQSLLKFLGGTSVLILVGVAMDTLAQIETFLLQSNYEGFMKHARVKGRRAYT